MHLPWQLHTASGSVVQGLTEPEGISWYLITVNRHTHGKKTQCFWTYINFQCP